MKHKKKRVVITQNVCNAFKVLLSAGLSVNRASKAMSFSGFTGYAIKNGGCTFDGYKKFIAAKRQKDKPLKTPKLNGQANKDASWDKLENTKDKFGNNYLVIPEDYFKSLLTIMETNHKMVTASYEYIQDAKKFLDWIKSDKEKELDKRIAGIKHL